MNIIAYAIYGRRSLEDRLSAPRSYVSLEERVYVYVPQSSNSRIVPSGDTSLEEKVQNYQANEGSAYLTTLEKYAQKPVPIVSYVRQDLPGAVAAVRFDDKKGQFIGSLEMEVHIGALASAYGVPKYVAERFVLDHEHTHLAQITSEKETYAMQRRIYEDLAQKTTGSQRAEYVALGKMALSRETDPKYHNN